MSTNMNLNQKLSEFEAKRANLVDQIGDSLEQVLSQINALNRSLEGIIEIGNEFASVEALWSQFETVLGQQDQKGEDDVVHPEDHDAARDGEGK